MMRVMVVEDEEMIRKGIVMAVDWAALDCIVVGEAANGEQALAVAEDCQPTPVSYTHLDVYKRQRRWS